MMLNAALVLAFLLSSYAFPVIPDRPFSGHFATAHFNSTGDVIPGEFIVTIAPGSDLQQSIAAVSRTKGRVGPCVNGGSGPIPH